LAISLEWQLKEKVREMAHHGSSSSSRPSRRRNRAAADDESVEEAVDEHAATLEILMGAFFGMRVADPSFSKRTRSVADDQSDSVAPSESSAAGIDYRGGQYSIPAIPKLIMTYLPSSFRVWLGHFIQSNEIRVFDDGKSPIPALSCYTFHLEDRGGSDVHWSLEATVPTSLLRNEGFETPKWLPPVLSFRIDAQPFMFKNPTFSFREIDPKKMAQTSDSRFRLLHCFFARVAVRDATLALREVIQYYPRGRLLFHTFFDFTYTPPTYSRSAALPSFYHSPGGRASVLLDGSDHPRLLHLAADGQRIPSVAALNGNLQTWQRYMLCYAETYARADPINARVSTDIYINPLAADDVEIAVKNIMDSL
jgi:hypothetical protein